MDMPQEKTVLIDQHRGVHYEVLAYRRLTEQELLFAVRMYHAQKRRKKPKRGDTITIVSIIGHDE